MLALLATNEILKYAGILYLRSGRSSSRRTRSLMVNKR